MLVARARHRHLAETDASLGEVMKDLIHILRNPYGYSEEEIREARLEASNEIENLRKALEELVRLKRMKDEMDRLESLLHYPIAIPPASVARLEELRPEYERCKPLAWAAARMALRVDP